MCVCKWGWIDGGWENGTCQRVARATGKLPPSLPGPSAAPTIQVENEGEKL